jgi:hypothetical protein
MISKDLLYALQTRDQKLIRELDRFTSDIKNHSLEEGWVVVAETIKLVRDLPPTQAKYGHVIKAINRAWLAFCDQSEAASNKLYETIVTALEETTWTHSDEAQVAYQLIFALHDNHFRFPSPNARLRVALRQHSPRLLGLIGRIAPHSARKLFATPIKPHTGTGADAVEMLFEIYFYHTGLGKDEDLCAEVAGLLLPLVRANPEIGNNITLSLLQYYPERSAVLSELIELYLIAGVHDEQDGMFFDIMLELLDNSGANFVYDDLDKITARLEVSSNRWTSGQFDTFARYAFFYGLKTDEDRRLLLTKSKKAMRLAGMIVDSGHSGQYVDTLRSLRRSIGQHPPGPAPSMAGAQQFKDLNFKLLVVEELMYVQKILLPRFDVEEFVKQHTDREIMIEVEGYAVIPEVLAYFEGLLIPSSLLAQVRELTFDGGNEVYCQIFPYWDGECDTFDVISPDDVDLVPSLKRMSCMPTRFVEQYGDALSIKAIQVD